LTPFQCKVLEAVSQIPPGEVRTYKEIAAAVGNPNAWRAVGLALKRNPFPVKIPCHRVVRSDGSLGGYFGKRNSKEKALLLLSELSLLQRKQYNCNKSKQHPSNRLKRYLFSKKHD